MTNKKAQDIAVERMMMITPLLAPYLDKASLISLKKNIAQDYNISYRTVGRYYEAYENEGFDGLKPKNFGGTKVSSHLPSNYNEIVEEAILLRRQLPSRSIPQIITILELEGYAKPGELKRSTLQRRLQIQGYGKKQMMIYQKKGAASRRFAKQHRCMLFQGDIKYGPYLPIGKDGKNKQVYLSAFIDDATRYVVHAKFYDHQKVEIIEDSLRHAIMGYGKPDAIYVDNGKQYRSKWLKKACAKLDIRLLFTKPYSPEAKGKIEAFNRTLDSFIAEANLQKPKDLDELNGLLDTWLHEYYHKKPHTSLGDVSPEIAFKTDQRALNFVDTNLLSEAFLHTDTREVDKVGCINFKGLTYEVGMNLIGRKVEVYYDPMWLEEVEIHHKDFKPFRVSTRTISEYCGIKGEMPGQLSLLESDSSRLLDGLKQSYDKSQKAKVMAISYKDLGGVTHV